MLLLHSDVLPLGKFQECEPDQASCLVPFLLCELKRALLYHSGWAWHCLLVEGPLFLRLLF